MARDSTPVSLIDRARKGDPRAIAKLISLVEADGAPGRDVLTELFTLTGRAWTVGLTGAPGAGKSTLTNRLIERVRSAGDRVAVVAVDPSSPFSGGAILGDRVRMQEHVDDAGVYIRSLASRGHLGGISEATPRAVAVLDAVGFPEILVETVGVGQAEVDVAAKTDTTVVVVNPRWGDSLQAAKAGLLEVGDVFVVNKADRPGVSETVRDLRQMLELGGERDWWPPIVPAVAQSGEGVDEIWGAVGEHRRHLMDSGRLADRRRERLVEEMRAEVFNTVRRRARRHLDDETWHRLIDEVVARRLDPWTAARQIADLAAAP